MVGRFGLGRKWVMAAAGALLLLCAIRTEDQLRYWQNSERLFQHALAVTRDNFMAHNNLAGDYYLRGNWDGVIEHYRASLELQPRQPQRLDVLRSLGEALSNKARYPEAIELFTEVLQARPMNEPVLVQLGIARARQGQPEEALRALNEALRLEPNDPAVHNSLGNVLAQQGRHAEAVRQFEEALRLQPGYPGALNNLAISCKRLGRIGEAITHYREALRVQPDAMEALNNLAWILAAHPDAQYRIAPEAITLATRACELTRYQNPIPLTTLAAAYGEAGQFRDAISLAEQAQALMPESASNSPLAVRLRGMITAFRGNKAYHGE
jgi:protein O-mannosyl-transferase